MKGVEQGWNTNKGIHVDQFGPFATPRMSKMGSYGGQNKLQIATQKQITKHKSAHRKYVGLEGTEQGWNTNEDIHTDQFATPRMSRIWPYWDQKGAKIG